MINPTIPTDHREAFVQAMTERMTTVARSLADDVQAAPRPLQDLSVSFTTLAQLCSRRYRRSLPLLALLLISLVAVDSARTLMKVES